MCVSLKTLIFTVSTAVIIKLNLVNSQKITRSEYMNQFDDSFFDLWFISSAIVAIKIIQLLFKNIIWWFSPNSHELQSDFTAASERKWFLTLSWFWMIWLLWFVFFVKFISKKSLIGSIHTIDMEMAQTQLLHCVPSISTEIHFR